MGARKYENPFYKVIVFSSAGFDTGLKVDDEAVIFPPGKAGTITDISKILLDAQRQGAKLEHLGLLTDPKLKAFNKKGCLVLTEKEGLMNPNGDVSEVEEEPEEEEESEE